MQPSVCQRLVQRVVEQRGHEAAQRLHADTETLASLEREDARPGSEPGSCNTPYSPPQLGTPSERVGVDLATVQHTLRHSSTVITGIYLIPDDDGLRQAIECTTLYDKELTMLYRSELVDI